MGQKVHPYGFRLGVTKTWRSRWFAKQDYAKLLHEDLELKESLRDRLKAAGVSSIEVDRPGNKLRITIRTSRPGIIIGRKGAEIEKLKGDLAKKTKREVFIDIQEVHKPELDAQLVSESIALQLEKRVAFRRAMRKAVDSALRFGCKGIKVRVSGRLNGAEIARSEWYLQGQLPLHTLRADIDYGFSQAYTTYGVIGIKVWVYKGEVSGRRQPPQLAPQRRRAAPPPPRRSRAQADCSGAFGNGFRVAAEPRRVAETGAVADYSAACFAAGSVLEGTADLYGSNPDASDAVWTGQCSVGTAAERGAGESGASARRAGEGIRVSARSLL